MTTTYIQPVKLKEGRNGEKEFWRIREVNNEGATVNFWDYTLEEKELADKQYQKLLDEEQELIKRELTED